MNGREAVGNLRADHEFAIPAVRGPQGVDAVRVNIGEQDKLKNEPLEERANRIVVEAVPGIIRAASAQIDVTAGFGVIAE